MTDFSILGFVEHIAAMTIEIEHETHDALEEAARIVEREAKDAIGTYQDDAGQFAAWAELADATKEDRLRQGYTENDPGLRSGAMRDSIEHVVQGHTAQIGSDDQNLVFFELGTARQPPRSVLGGAAYRSGHEVAEVIGSHFVAALVGAEVLNGSLPIELHAGELGPAEGEE
nr:hypothetical protein [uncultured Lichenicoccus sp.]